MMYQWEPIDKLLHALRMGYRPNTITEIAIYPQAVQDLIKAIEDLRRATDAKGVPELTEDDIADIQDAWPGLEDSDPDHYFVIHEHGIREGYKLACERLTSQAPAKEGGRDESH